jgi:hypothetical protein
MEKYSRNKRISEIPGSTARADLSNPEFLRNPNPIPIDAITLKTIAFIDRGISAKQPKCHQAQGRTKVDPLYNG